MLSSELAGLGLPKSILHYISVRAGPDDVISAPVVVRGDYCQQRADPHMLSIPSFLSFSPFDIPSAGMRYQARCVNKEPVQYATLLHWHYFH